MEVSAAAITPASARRAKIGTAHLDLTYASPVPCRLTMATVVTTELGAGHLEAAVALWEQVGLTRPWNDARDDFARAVHALGSAVPAPPSTGSRP